MKNRTTFRPTLLSMQVLVCGLVFTMISCNNQTSTIKDTSVELKKAHLVYNISGESTTSGWNFEVFFDTNNTRINADYALTASKTYIYDKRSNEILGLINDFALNMKLKDSYFIYYTPKDLAESSNYSDTTITVTKDFKEILGYKCRKTIINHGGGQTEEILWTTDKIKPGINYTGTPLMFDNLALEYEEKVLGKTQRKYVIKSISDESIDLKEFQQKVPDEYYLVVPASVFSLDSMWAKEYIENEFTSFQYPTFKKGRSSVKEFIQDNIVSLLPKDKQKNITLEFIVSKNGDLQNILIDYGSENKHSNFIQEKLSQMPKWTPAKVKGQAVKSKVTIFI